jgi:hypothetical protein
MRESIVYIICVAILGASAAAAAETAPTITVYTEPPELEIWVDGRYLGVGDAVFFGPFEDYVKVTVTGTGYQETTEIVDPPTVEGEDVTVVIVSEKVRGFSWVSLGIGVGIGVGTFLAIFAWSLLD